MVFSSITFIFAFLPCEVIGYYHIFNKTRKQQNMFLLFCSLLFYAWGGIQYLALMLFSIAINWGFGLWIERATANRKKLLALDIICNLALLFVFKYLMFTVKNINLLFKADIRCPNIVLPIGISFFTFQAMSYVIDVYRGEKALRNPLDLGLYISFFPQLVAGPIVRYETIKTQLYNRVESDELIQDGIEKFIIGLAKKSLIANTLACISEKIFALDELQFSLAWLGAIAYTLQIYYDFSGYSDMAIGLGKMFGFVFPENFNYPYSSKSLTEFWRRWHISMGTWFRDYVYFPLGGSRNISRCRVIFNLFVVWLCTGIWHGANWTFILWGLLQFFVLVAEKFLFKVKKNNRDTAFFGRVITLLVVIIGWVLFNSETVVGAFQYIRAMFSFDFTVSAYCMDLVKQNWIVLLIAAVFSFPVFPWVQNQLSRYQEDRIVCIGLKIVYAVLFVVSVVYIAKGTYNPFIYFNF